jgi:hypothetical protein
MIAFNQPMVFHQAALDMNFTPVAKTPYITMPAFAAHIKLFVFPSWSFFKEGDGKSI